MPFWKAGKNDDQVLEENKLAAEQKAAEFPKNNGPKAKSETHVASDAPAYDPQYILQVKDLKKHFPIKGGMISQIGRAHV